MVRLPRRDRDYLRMPEAASDDAIAKPSRYLPTYEHHLKHLRSRRFALLELGVWKGASLAMWCAAFPKATIVGVDLQPAAELSVPPGAHFFSGEQSDATLLAAIRNELAPQGFDVIVDDASHLAQNTADSLRVLFNDHLSPGGKYFIEDWRTGYLPNWPDGCSPAKPLAMSSDIFDGPKPAGHACGMVALVKQIVDHVAGDVADGPGPERHALAVASLEVHEGIVILTKDTTSGGPR